ncbi:MAG: hypothetical protein ABTQ32_25150 [Myxococcaceae bacterium]
MRALVLVPLLLAGCPEKKSSVDENDPLIQKLKAEQARLDKGGAPGGPPGASPMKEPPQPLADIVQQPPDVPVNVTVKSAAVTVGDVTLTPKRLETAQIVAGPKVKLSTAERFVKLVVTISTTKDTSFDLAKATLVKGAETFELARDVQRVGQGSPLASTISAGVSQDLVLFFEVPPASLAEGLKLVLPAQAAPIEVTLL